MIKFYVNRNAWVLIETAPEEKLKGRQGKLVTSLLKKLYVETSQQRVSELSMMHQQHYFNKISLNQCLHTGPLLLPKITDMLLSVPNR